MSGTFPDLDKWQEEAESLGAQVDELLGNLSSLCQRLVEGEGETEGSGEAGIEAGAAIGDEGEVAAKASAESEASGEPSRIDAIPDPPTDPLTDQPTESASEEAPDDSADDAADGAGDAEASESSGEDAAPAVEAESAAPAEGAAEDAPAATDPETSPEESKVDAELDDLDRELAALDEGELGDDQGQVEATADISLDPADELETDVADDELAELDEALAAPGSDPTGVADELEREFGGEAESEIAADLDGAGELDDAPGGDAPEPSSSVPPPPADEDPQLDPVPTLDSFGGPQLEAEAADRSKQLDAVPSSVGFDFAAWCSETSDEFRERVREKLPPRPEADWSGRFGWLRTLLAWFGWFTPPVATVGGSITYRESKKLTLWSLARLDPVVARLINTAYRPINAQPAQVRSALGWIGLYTLFIAMCVWMFVLFFRAPNVPEVDGGVFLNSGEPGVQQVSAGE